jgi:hypothetical protein
MQHPEVFLLPVLMLLDYLLTIAGSKLAARKYNRHFKFEHYEMNPLWQKTIAQGKWFSFKHFLGVVFAGFICFVWADTWREKSEASEGALGALLTLFSVVLAAHVGNLMIFWRMVRNPDEVCGEVTLSHKYLLAMSRSRSLMALFPISMAAWLAPSPFLYGGVGALVTFNVIQAIWAFNYRAKPSPEAA